MVLKVNCEYLKKKIRVPVLSPKEIEEKNSKKFFLGTGDDFVFGP
jgi:hypothetical protein